MFKWRIGKPDAEKVDYFLKKTDLNRLVLEILSARGIDDEDSIVNFFTEQELEDPFAIKDVDKAVQTIEQAVDAYELICVYGDYDCDGITSTSILFNYLESMGANVMYYIPEREAGYGMNIAAIEELADKDVKLIVTVDNGISSVEEAKRCRELGIKLVVTDHHQVGEVLPDAEAIVDPHRPDCPSSFKDLCGAGVALKLCAALDGGSYDAVLEQYSDLCSIGTVADIVPLKGENRTLVRSGFRYLPNTENAGLGILLDKLKIDRKKIVSDHIGFRIGPVINASGRFGSPLTAVKAILSEDPEDAESYVDTMITLNTQRKKCEQDIMKDIEDYIRDNPNVLDHRVIVLAGKGWHHGVIGIVASKILDRYSKPAIIISIEDGGMARGSARSVKGLNIHSCLTYCAELLTKFGGHECAGGFSLKEEDIEKFRAKVYEFAAGIEKPAVRTLYADKVLMPADIDVEMVKGLSVLEPIGEGNPKPLFAILGARVTDIISLKDNAHTKVAFSYGRTNAYALMFGQDPTKLCFGKGDLIDMMVELDINVFNDRESVSVKVVDHRLSGVKQERYFAAKDTYEKIINGEEVPVSFIKKVIPERAELVGVYKYLNSVREISLDALFMRLSSDSMNYCKLRIITDIFRDKELISYDGATMMINILPAHKKVELEESDTLVKLRKMTEENE
ncbi:MAG: single-stranded-DNA-specific exonuclease RecJ [Ruminococcus sp.]|uniref:single-stranded-DNA-specific exonuclease RecJ n=1 Tax=Ruminococcus sp. TaxID=41978 RepID=UPI0025EFECEE|nr:single-stranded-DNA-specific exonuclease RecJ [Ruminococcus sp.]MCR5540526.1 single-stranded-DNA-specific exonuclease RecJ [Ruminococcus sp.]